MLKQKKTLVRKAAMKNKEEIYQKIHDLFSAQKFAVLSTNKNGQPYSNLVAFASTPDIKTLYFATTRATRKYANISSDARVALFIDSRTNRSSDFSTAIAVSATGTTEELGRDERQQALEIYLAKHPELKDFVLSPTCALLKVTVSAYSVVSRFQNVQELRVS